MRQVTLIAGPPCAGKSTMARDLASPGATILDLDDFAVAAGSPTRWMHTPFYSQPADTRMRRASSDIFGAHEIEAWIIRCAPTMQRRWEYASRARATRVVVLVPPVELCLRRAASRPDGTVQAVERWFERYTPHRKDIVICSAEEL